MRGSPPQVRGKPNKRHYLEQLCRITPAGAGKTFQRRTVECCVQDHPRRCGENSVSIPLIFDSAGSPPQVRGKQLKQHCAECCARITPAGAGKTLRAHVNAVVTADHPRRCGENADLLVAKRGALGSPPQVRGKLGAALEIDTTARITPAGAGKTFYAVSMYSLSADHPRRCGENQANLSACRQTARITPAGAGKTSSQE